MSLLKSAPSCQLSDSSEVYFSYNVQGSLLYFIFVIVLFPQKQYSMIYILH